MPDSLLLSLRCSPGSAAAAAAASNRLLPPLPFRSQPGRSSASPLQNGAKRSSAAAPIEPPRTAPGAGRARHGCAAPPADHTALHSRPPPRRAPLGLARARARAQLPSAPPRPVARARSPDRAAAVARGAGRPAAVSAFSASEASLTFAENRVNCYRPLTFWIKVAHFKTH